MVWFWGAKSPSAASQDAPPLPSEHPAQVTHSAAPPTQATTTASSRAAPTGSDPEVNKFLEEFMGEAKSAAAAQEAAAAQQQQQQQQQQQSQREASTSQASSSWASRWKLNSASSSSATNSTPEAEFSSLLSTTENDNPTNQPRLSPLAESLLPTTMDCETAFNLAFYCQSLGGQWNAIYRHGTIRSCSEQWEDFWFCMRAKGAGDGPVKENMIRDHYREKLLRKYGNGKPNSEDVWKERRERVAPGEAFSVQVEAPKMSDAEFQKWEMERMERIRKGLEKS